MIKNYLLIAEKWKTLFDNPSFTHSCTTQFSPEFSSFIQAFIDHIIEKDKTSFSSEALDVFKMLLCESFLSGFMLWGLENNIDLYKKLDQFSDDQVQQFIQIIDNSELFDIHVERIELVSESLISKASFSFFNRFLLLHPEKRSEPYNQAVTIQNHFYFSSISGYILGSFYEQ